jgi:hypothetical protein
MPDAKPDPRAIASLFDLRRPESREELLELVGPELFPQFEVPGHPFVAYIMEGGPHGTTHRLSLQNEAKVIEFYRMTLRINTTPDSPGETVVIPRNLAPELVEALREAARIFALEKIPPSGSA